MASRDWAGIGRTRLTASWSATRAVTSGSRMIVKNSAGGSSKRLSSHLGLFFLSLLLKLSASPFSPSSLSSLLHVPAVTLPLELVLPSPSLQAFVLGSFVPCVLISCLFCATTGFAHSFVLLLLSLHWSAVCSRREPAGSDHLSIGAGA